MFEFYGVVYIASNQITGKCYIGQTTEEIPADRWNV